MAHWNYRVIKRVENGETLFDLQEVHYDDEGTVYGYSDASVTSWDTLENLRGTLELMRQAFDQPVMDETTHEIDGETI